MSSSQSLLSLTNAASVCSASCTSRKPAPRSKRVESSPSTDAFALLISALRTAPGPASGIHPRSSAAAPATVGVENDVPETNRTRERQLPATAVVAPHDTGAPADVRAANAFG